MPDKPVAQKHKEDYREAFLARLNRTLAVPAREWPTVRFWTPASLKLLFKQIRSELAAEGVKSALTHNSLCEWLCSLNLASQVPVEDGTVSLTCLGADAETDADPLELLMACKPTGVVCYFSSLGFYGLTTQFVTHHHVAELRPAALPTRSERRSDDVEAASVEPSGSSDAAPRVLGKLLFRFQGIPFYATRRSARLVPGVQMRGYGPRGMVRITTLEQALLDTLSKPFHCGGPEVVFEAWHEAVASRRIDEERLLEHLERMNYPATARRLGVVLGLAGSVPGIELRRFLEVSRGTIDRESPHARISLLPGVDYRNLNDLWMVDTP